MLGCAFRVCRAPVLQELLMPQLPPDVSMVNPQLAEILQGYKNALDAALMATRLISSAQSSNVRQPPMRSEARKNDAIEVCCNIQSLLLMYSFYSCNTMLAHYLLSSRVHLSITSQCYTKMANLRISKSMLHNSP